MQPGFHFLGRKMSGDITIQLDLKEFEKKAAQMNIFANDQMPFAIANTLNDTMFKDTRPQIIGPTWRAAFVERNKGLPRASINVLKASKTMLTAGVFDALHKADLAKHAEGGEKTHSGRLAIPNRSVVALTASGKAPWARELEKKYPKHMARGHLVPSVQKTAKGLFVGQSGKLVLFFSFSPKAHLSKRFKFYEDFKRVSLAGINQRFPAQIQRAVATAFGR